MKMFWRIEGAEQPLYTGKSFVQYVVHKKRVKNIIAAKDYSIKRKIIPKNYWKMNGIL